MSTPYYGPDEDENTINIERFFVAGDFVSGVGYGVQLILWAKCALYLWKQRQRSIKTRLLLYYISLLLTVQTITSIVQARTVQEMYIENRNYPGGPWVYFLDTQSQPVNVLFDSTVFILTFLCDLLVLWRCWVIWTCSGRATAYVVTLFPFIVLMASFVMGTLWTLESTHPGLSLYSKKPLAFGTAYYALSFGLNIILTILIVFRLLAYRRTYLRVLPPEHVRHYLSLVTLFVESAALYSVFAIAFLISYALNKPINQVWLAFAGPSQQIATYLIIYRVADGTAWTTRTTMDSHSLPSMEFTSASPDKPSRLATLNFNGTSTTGLDVTTDADSRELHPEK
ncbi:hypothetical protein L226DRAFT_450718 [Lentinus tigrinus ALCF2SS1-7]|uniref:uncharacterized protein n=1 Tax=Lentinus tigrinus ALCF2SS1-7 TaxID=1328758 RepID=UPI001165EB36|nr:hypothetical protein L226DRAFT_450718 [Lentinus tigrinus ALCF2SS1-7]